VDISTSVGIAYLPADASPGEASADALVKSADEAMYRAKRSGRGQIRLVGRADGTGLGVVPPGAPTERHIPVTGVGAG
jgi:predicted signal transduction protein with EAL and GGDEF domain